MTFQPRIVVRRRGAGMRLRFGALPGGGERPLGAEGIVSLTESLRIYYAALKRHHIEIPERVPVIEEGAAAG
jgi:hypothetical protein